MKIFHHAISSFSKYLPNIHSRKRSRSELLSTEKSGSSSSCDRSLPGPNLGKKGAVGTAVSKVFEHDQQIHEERTKKAVPNKRTRTSLTDIRVMHLRIPRQNIQHCFFALWFDVFIGITLSFFTLLIYSVASIVYHGSSLNK